MEHDEERPCLSAEWEKGADDELDAELKFLELEFRRAMQESGAPIDGRDVFEFTILSRSRALAAVQVDVCQGESGIATVGGRYGPIIRLCIQFSMNQGYPATAAPQIKLSYATPPDCSVFKYCKGIALPPLETTLNATAAAMIGKKHAASELLLLAIASLRAAVCAHAPAQPGNAFSVHRLVEMEVRSLGSSRAKQHFRQMKSFVDKELQQTPKLLNEMQSILLNQVGDDVVVGKLLLSNDLFESSLPVASNDAEGPTRGGPALQSLRASLGGLRVPFNDNDVECLYWDGDESEFGVDGLVGNVLDSSTRSSREHKAGQLNLQHPFDNFDFPAEVQKIKQTLCPTAEKIAIRPYKLIVYQPGDFFSVHVDTMKHALQFGSLAVELPVDDEPEAEEAEPQNGEAGNDGEGDDDCSETADDGESSNSEESPEGGELCFYLGRSVDPSPSLNQPESRETLLRGHYHRYDRNKPHGFSETQTIRVPRLKYRDCVLGGTLDQPSSLQLQYAAWRGDVQHELLPLKKGWRVVLIYRLFKLGDVPLKVPAKDELLMQMDGALRELRQQSAAAHAAYLQRAASSPSTSPPGLPPPTVRNIGFMLRHQYPPAGLHPAALKGVDAVAWTVFSSRWQCFLLPGTEMREDELSAPFRMNDGAYGPHVRVIFSTSERISSHQELHSESSFATAECKYPLILDCLWIQLGFGMLEGGGAFFGNADCGTDWWYRTAVLIVTLEPSPFKRRLPAFLVGLRGPPTMQRLYQCFDVFQHMAGYL